MFNCAESRNIRTGKNENSENVNSEIKIKRKFVKVQMNNKEVKFQLNIGSDVILINTQTLKKIGR